jgi:hypothetical protein
MNAAVRLRCLPWRRTHRSKVTTTGRTVGSIIAATITTHMTKNSPAATGSVPLPDGAAP